MAGTNDFLTFANGGGSNVISQAAYAALGARSSGFVTGEAASDECNKVWRQGAYAAAALGKIISDSNRNALDDGNLAAFVTNLLAAISDLMEPRLPPGALLEWGGPPATAPVGQWVEGLGQVVSRTGTFANLFAVFGTTYNTGGEAGTDFRLPDYRGTFLRVKDAGRGLDPGRAMNNTPQADAYEAHAHNMSFEAFTEASGGTTNHQGFVVGDQDISIGTIVNGTAVQAAGGAATETRPVNMAIRVFIAY